GQLRPNIDVAESVGAKRARSMIVIVGEKFGLVGGNINPDGAIALAAFASQTEIERFFNMLVPPATLNDIPFGHFPEQVRAPTGGVLLFASGTKTGTHHATFILAAFANSNAAQGGTGQASMVFGKLKMGLRLPGPILRTEAQVFIQPVRLDDLAGIHLPIRIPNGLEFAKRLHQLGSKHFRQQLGP